MTMGVMSLARRAGVGNRPEVLAFAKGELERVLRADYHPLLVRARRLAGNVEDAQDLLHDTFERALSHRRHDEPCANASGWLTVIMRNLAIDRRRSEARRRSALDVEAVEVHPPEDEPLPAWAWVEKSDVERALSAIDEPLSLAFRMRWEGGHSYREIGERLGIPSPTVATRLWRAKRKLRAALLRHRESS
ncbi:MAG TPA: RNA polymerase sigma factor [Polyangiaceae bacterium]|nr:RNA polymerase sigma factor [Polyangiaceae bacterium]